VCIETFSKFLAYKGITVCQTPSSNPKLLMAGRLIAIELVCENP